MRRTKRLVRSGTESRERIFRAAAAEFAARGFAGANVARIAAAAAHLRISESALKARLASARAALLAQTTTEAIQRARDYRLI